MNCRICDYKNTDPKFFFVNDKMFSGTKNFEYFVCSACGTLQITTIPAKMSNFYPANYYSFKSLKSLKEKIIDRVRDLVFYYDFPKTLVDKLSIKIPNLALQAFLKTKPTKKAEILDVGCGEGKFLKSIYHLGFKNILGIEPFALQTQEKPFPILKKNLKEITKKFDIITFNHVFEHVADVNETLRNCFNILNKNGIVIIRVPVKDSYAYEAYGENWVQWDAPRHFQLLTKKAFELISVKNNFKLENYYNDSYKFQFTGSEKYKRSLSYQTSNSIFTKEELENFKNKAMELNKLGKGDQVVVVFRKS